MEHWLKARRDELGLSQKALIDRLEEFGIKRRVNAVSHWEAGNPIPLLISPKEVNVLAQALEWSKEELISKAFDIQIYQLVIDNADLNYFETQVLAIMRRFSNNQSAQKFFYEVLATLEKGYADSD